MAIDKKDMEEINNIFEHNFIMDLKKKEANPFLRAEIIKNHMEKNDLSGRKFALKYKIPKSTVEDWLLFSKIDEDDYKQMKNSGLNNTEIYRNLRNRKKEPIKDVVKETKLDYDLKTCLSLLRTHVNAPTFTNESSILLSDLQNIINRIKMKLDKQMR